MKSLTEYINEAKTDFYGTIIQSIDIDTSLPKDKLKEILKDGLEKAIDKYKIIRIGAVEKANEESDLLMKSKIEKALKKGEQDILKLMQSKPGILKRSPQKQQEWIDSKIEKLKSELGKEYSYLASKCKVEFDNDKVGFGWHHDIWSEHGYSSYSGLKQMSNVIDDIIKEILNKDDYKNHLKSIQVLSKDFTNTYPTLHIFPIFDEDFESELSKSVQKFGDFMTKEYQSGRYMGD